MNPQEQAEVDEHPKMYLYRRIVTAKTFIDKFYHRKLHLHDLSKQACLSKFHFLRTFKKAYGKSPHQYLTEVRINASKKHLRAGIPVAVVCGMVGFESTPSFIHLFKKKIGVSPETFKRKHESCIEKTIRISPLIYSWLFCYQAHTNEIAIFDNCQSTIVSFI